MKYIKSLTVALSFASAAALQATTIDYLADGTTTAPSHTNFTSGTVDPLVGATKNGISFLGVDGGTSGTEIDVGQSIIVSFDNDYRLTSLSFALLFNGPEYKDKNEVAAASVGADTYKLVLSGENNANWYKNNVWQFNVSGGPTVLGGFGLFTINNPFGMVYVSSFSVYPISINPKKGSSDSDFGLHAFSAVPDSGSTLALMGVALLGFAGLSRRFRR